MCVCVCELFHGSGPLRYTCNRYSLRKKKHELQCVTWYGYFVWHNNLKSLVLVDLSQTCIVYILIECIQYECVKLPCLVANGRLNSLQTQSMIGWGFRLVVQLTIGNPEWKEILGIWECADCRKPQTSTTNPIRRGKPFKIQGFFSCAGRLIWIRYWLRGLWFQSGWRFSWRDYRPWK